MPGFIHDKLEIKFLILYIAARLEEPVPMDTLLDLALCDEGVGYFDFTECLRDLVDTGHLLLSDGLYEITEKGVRNSKICESDLPYTVRLKCDRNVVEQNRILRRKRQVRASWEKRFNGTYTLHLALDDDIGSVLDAHFMIPQEEVAKELAERFQREPEKIYTRIMEVLLATGRDKQSES